MPPTWQQLYQKKMQEDDGNPDNAGYSQATPQFDPLLMSQAQALGPSKAEASGPLPNGGYSGATPGPWANGYVSNGDISPELKKQLTKAFYGKPEERNPAETDQGDDKNSSEGEGQGQPEKMLPGDVQGSFLRNNLMRQAGGVGETEKLIDQFRNANNQPNLAPLLSLVDSQTGSNFSRNYQQPMSPQEKNLALIKLQDELQKQRQGLTGDAVNLQKLGSNNDTKMFLASMKPGQGIDRYVAAQQTKADQEELKHLRELDKGMAYELDPSRPRSGTFGDLSRRSQQGERLLALLGRYPDFNLDKRQTADFSIGLAGLISTGANGLTDSKVNALMPESARGKFQGWKEWLSNNPQGLEQQAFIQRMANDAKAEVDTVNDQLQNVRAYRMSRFDDLRDAGGKWEQKYNNYLNALEQSKKMPAKAQAAYDRLMQVTGAAVPDNTAPKVQMSPEEIEALKQQIRNAK